MGYAQGLNILTAGLGLVGALVATFVGEKMVDRKWVLVGGQAITVGMLLGWVIAAYTNSLTVSGTKYYEGYNNNGGCLGTQIVWGFGVGIVITETIIFWVKALPRSGFPIVIIILQVVVFVWLEIILNLTTKYPYNKSNSNGESGQAVDCLMFLIGSAISLAGALVLMKSKRETSREDLQSIYSGSTAIAPK